MDVESGGDVGSTQGRTPASGVHFGGAPSGDGTAAPAASGRRGVRRWVPALLLGLAVLEFAVALGVVFIDRDWWDAAKFALFGLWFLVMAHWFRRDLVKADRAGRGS